jgi:adenine C2-methylase RlmN of 23S rRNA A2503 and tRNA A37
MVVACRVLAADPAADASITNVVFMGMGEPLHNYDAVMAAVDIMCQPLGLHMSHNKVGTHNEITACICPSCGCCCTPPAEHRG